MKVSANHWIMIRYLILNRDSWQVIYQLLEVIKFNLFKKLFKTRFVEWNDYKNKIDFLEYFYWQQGVHKQSIRNL